MGRRPWKLRCLSSLSLFALARPWSDCRAALCTSAVSPTFVWPGTSDTFIHVQRLLEFASETCWQPHYNTNSVLSAKHPAQKNIQSLLMDICASLTCKVDYNCSTDAEGTGHGTKWYKKACKGFTALGGDLDCCRAWEFEYKANG